MNLSSSLDFLHSDRFTLIRGLGEGGFGAVYEAVDRQSSARVALKVLREAAGAALLRFKEEFRLFSRLSLDHANLVTLYDLFEQDRRWFFTMELIRGVPLTTYVRSSGPEEADTTSRVLNDTALRSTFAQLANALHSIHTLDLVHCDIKPSNILVTTDERVVVLDFGLATVRPTQLSESSPTDRPLSRVLGTPGYMAPEQCLSDTVTPATDWYSFGVVLYEALTGERPFKGSPMTVLETKQWAAPIPPRELAASVPHDLMALALRLLDPHPGSRPGVEEVLRVLRPELVRVDASRAARPVADLFVGRAAQLAELQRAFNASKTEAVIAVVFGQSGMGKSTLLERFLTQERDRDPDLLTFEGRCYERESMPHKALDPLLDKIAQHWKSLSEADAARLMPRDAALLAHMFPVLGQVREVQRASARGNVQIDSVTLRHRAAEALRDLLHRLGAPLILMIDDAQWGDTDSAAILEQVLRQPDGPPLLLIVSSRSESMDESRFIGRLRALHGESRGPRLEEVELGPLAVNETQELTVALTGLRREDSRVEAIARESGGNAFFIHELARFTSAEGTTSVDAVVWNRIQTLSDAARGFVTAVALSAQPLPSRVVRAAARLDPEDTEPFQLLRAARLIRTRAGSEDAAFEPYHDRIREAIVSRLSGSELIAWHRRLADAWASSPLARPETLVTHYLSAGDEPKARPYLQVAAHNAAEALAFDRAADFYELLIRLEPDRSLQLTWHAKHGVALANAGRGRDAARAFLQAIDEPMTDRSIRLEGQAAAELIRIGYVDEANVVLARVLPKVGVRLPTGAVGALVTALWYQTLLRIRGPRVSPRAEADVSSDVLRRIDVLFAVGEPLSFTSMLRGRALLIQGVWHAVRAGEPKRAFRALTVWALARANAVRTRERLLDQARAQPEADTDPWRRAVVLFAEGLMMKSAGQMRRAVEQLERALELLAECHGFHCLAECRGLHNEVTTAQTVLHDSLLWMGQWRRMAAELPKRLQAAEQRGDIYLASYANLRTVPVLWLAADRLDRARADLATSMDRWISGELKFQRRHALCTQLDLALYAGDGEIAHDVLSRAWPGLRAINFLYQFGRIEMTFYRARIALARARQNRRYLNEAARHARRLAGERVPWAVALGSLVDASVSLERQGPARTIDSLKAAERLLRESDLHLYAAAAQLRRGMLVGGSTGTAIVERSREWMKDQGIVNAEAICNMLAPGLW